LPRRGLQSLRGRNKNRAANSIAKPSFQFREKHHRRIASADYWNSRRVKVITASVSSRAA
jgi:hypothetical protein